VFCSVYTRYSTDAALAGSSPAVLVEAGQRDADAGDERLLGPELTVADRLLAEAGGVVVERLRERVEGGVAGGGRPLGVRRGELHLEGEVVDLAETGHLGGRGLTAGLGGLQVVVAGDVGEEVRVALGVRAVGRVVPGVDEGLRVDGGAVVEGPAVLERDGPGLLVLGLDGLRDAGVDGLVGLVSYSTRPVKSESTICRPRSRWCCRGPGGSRARRCTR
jgi:hypothetical protein